jgi:large repetitive protein
MRQTLRSLVWSFLCIVPALAFAQAPQTRTDCPGVPGACGYPANSNANARTISPPQSPQNGNGTLGVIYDQAKCGLDWTAASQRLGKRFTPAGVNQPAPFVIAGIPTCAVIEKAYLWAEGSGNGAAQTATVSGPAGTGNFPMAIVGQGPDKCWSYAGSYTYRADVTSMVNGNGTYNISGILTNPPTSGNDMDGATLLVIWSQASATWQGRCIIADGAIVVNGGTSNYNLPISPAVCGATTNGRAFAGIGDIQMAVGSLTLNGTNSPVTWNWWNFQTVNTTVNNGQTTSNFNCNTGGDCFNFCIAGLSFRTTTCAVCPTTTAFTVSATSTPASCSACNGTAAVTVSPAGSYTYTWSPAPGAGQGTATPSLMCAGTYTVTVTNACNTVTATVTVATSGGSITVNNAGQTNVACNGQCTGTATVSVVGGTGPYTYAWTPAPGGGQGTATVTGLCAGSYVCNVTDATGCTGSQTITITQPPAITATQSQVNVTCNGACTGTASVVASGGNGTYTYTWAPAPGGGQGTANATGLCAGTYTCTICSPAGCCITKTFTITQPPAITATQSQVNVTCNGQCNGTASVVASGGNGTYTYTWAPAPGGGQGTANATGLCAGTYSCTICSPAGCCITKTFTITQPPAITAMQSQVNVTCNGACTGTASVVASGGTGTYTYNWAPAPGGGQGTANATGLCAGSYVCTISSPAGCSINVSFTITQPPAITATQSQVNVTCNGACTGTASVVASGGNGTYTYTWAPAPGGGQGTANATGLCAGSYTCTICSPAGCCITKTFTITQPPAITATQSQVNVTCNGACTGTASVVAAGGNGTYTYTWAPAPGGGQGTANATGLCAGSYTCTICSPAGCCITKTFTITQPPVLTASTSSTLATCGNANGTATGTGSGGTGPYTYSWNTTPVQNTQTATGLLAGTYIVTVTDANNCTTTATVTVSSALSPTVTITASTNVTCYGGTNGSATAAGSGGTGPYTYSWNTTPVQNTATATNLAAGTYIVTVTDANLCTSTTTVTITQPLQITATQSQVNVTCNGACTGTASVVASGGTGTYTYSWAPAPGGGQGTANATGLCAGSYVCTISSPAGCSINVSFTITQPPAITATQSQVNVTCNGACTGTASVVASGGNGTYTYNWAPAPGGGQGTANATGLCAGAYVCTISSPAGCSINVSFTITQPPVLTATASATMATCGNANGTATGTGSGGVGPYTYSWNTTPIQNTQTATGLTTGNYIVTVTDANNCTTTATVNVPTAATPTVTITATVNVTCFGGTNGSATATTTGGSGPYSYSWNTTPLQNTPTAINLAAGTYIVTVTDANLCVSTATVTITQPPQITATQSQVNVTCFGTCDGSASVVAAGGTGTYTYNWSPAPGGGQGTANATGLCAGTYSCVISSPVTCSITVTFSITQPPQITATQSQVNVSCNGGCTGTASVVAAGGTGTYTYNWTPAPGGGQGTANATGLCAGTYSCLISSPAGCSITPSFTITQPAALVLSAAATQSTCGNPNGSATVTITGGVSPYTVVWNTVPAQAGPIASNLLAGTYVATVTDANNCTATVSVTVPNAGSPAAVISSITNVTCFGGNDGSIDITPSGGTLPYTFSWNSSPVQTNEDATALPAGTYACTVVDANGCIAVVSATITEPPQLTIAGSSAPADCFGNATGSASVAVTGGIGTYTYSWNSTPVQNSATATGLVAGTYICTVNDSNGCVITETVVITEPTQLTLSIAGFNVSCYNACDGQAVVIPAGGTGTYTFNWSQSGCTTAACSGVCAGSYSVTVTDQNGCVAIDSTTVTQPAAISITTSAVDAHCNQADGAVGSSATGGSGTLTYQWISGPATQNATGMPANTYTVIVTDQNGCSDSATALVANLNGVNATLTSVTNLTCNGSNDGQIVTGASGGNSPYTYSWTAPASSATGTATGLSAGSYSLTVTDADGCTSLISAIVTQPPVLSVTATATPSSVCAGSPVQLVGGANGGTPGYTYNWTPGALVGSTQNLTPTQTDTYVVTATDVNGCTATASVVATINPVPVAGATANILTGCAPLCVDFSDLSNVAAPGVINSWSWDYGDGTSTQQNPSHCYATPGQYTIILTVTTADGCTSTLTLANYIDVYAMPVAGFTASPQPTTILDPVITFTDTSTNAATWFWSFGDSLGTSTLQNPTYEYLNPTCYQVVLSVASSDGCVDTAVQNICIGPDAMIFVPNAFTPNEDNINDVFMPVGVGIDPEKFEMWIFDRWGNLIFYTDDLNKGWDGKVQGASEVSQIDTYVWKIQAVDITGTKHNLVGKVSLIR